MCGAVRAAAIVCMGLAAGMAAPVAQTRPPRPDFSGTWELVTATAMSPNSNTLLKFRGTITQDESTITFSTVDAGVRRQPDGRNATYRETRSTTYRLDGAESKHVSTFDGGTSTTTAGTRWVQNALLITTQTDNGRSQWEDLLVCSLNGLDVLHIYASSSVLDMHGMGSALFVYRRVQP